MKFECKMCGECCRNMRGRVAKTPPKLPPYLFMAVSRSLKTIGLFEWEVPILRTKAKRLSISLRVKPDTVIWDEKSKKPIVTMWNLDHDNCPFLSEDNKCRIYRHRPLVCQTYPLMTFGLVGDASEKGVHWMDCPNAVEPPLPKGRRFMVQTSTIFTTLFEVYGRTFLGALRYEGAHDLVFDYLKEGKNQKALHPAIIKNKIIKAILRSKPIGLFEFLQSKRVVAKKEIQKSIEGIYNLTFENLGKMIRGQ